jgi:hypothetical protein
MDAVTERYRLAPGGSAISSPCPAQERQQGSKQTNTEPEHFVRGVRPVRRPGRIPGPRRCLRYGAFPYVLDQKPIHYRSCASKSRLSFNSRNICTCCRHTDRTHRPFRNRKKRPISVAGHRPTSRGPTGARTSTKEYSFYRIIIQKELSGKESLHFPACRPFRAP